MLVGLTVTNDSESRLNSYTASVAKNVGLEALVMPSTDVAEAGKSNEPDQPLSNGGDLRGYAQMLKKHAELMESFSELSFSSRGFVQSQSAELSTAA
jgi:hypothetical protein